MSTQMTIQGLFNASKEQWLDEARMIARKLLRYNEFITIEDVLEVCPRPAYLHRNTTGSVFLTSDFVPVGYVKAKKASSNGRAIRTWKLRGTF